jgi:hypothetical protein
MSRGPARFQTACTPHTQEPAMNVPLDRTTWFSPLHPSLLIGAGFGVGMIVGAGLSLPWHDPKALATPAPGAIAAEVRTVAPPPRAAATGARSDVPLQGPAAHPLRPPDESERLAPCWEALAVTPGC